MMVEIILCAALVGFIAFAWWFSFHHLPRPKTPPRLTVFTTMEERIRQIPTRELEKDKRPSSR